MDIANAILYFFIYSFLGWFLETTYATVLKRKVVNRGFLKGCFCPIYGFGALISFLSFKIAEIAIIDKYYSVILGVLFSAVFATLLEYVSSIILIKVFKRRYWDYSKKFANINGHICLKFSLLWGGISLFIVKSVHPYIVVALSGLSEATKSMFSFVLLFCFITDLILTSYFIFKKTYEKNMDSYKNEYQKCVKDLISCKTVNSMSQFVQHGNVSCLEHCNHVSYYSFIICKVLKLDFKSAARGGLLHDYFLYDWHYSPYRLHGFFHPRYALLNATRDFCLNEIERDIIIKHMWPLTLTPPKYKEAFIVSMADKYCTVVEVISSKNFKFVPYRLKEYIKLIYER